MRTPTIYDTLTAKLGREPTNAECKEDVFRILREGRASSELARAARTPAGAARRAALKAGA